MAFDLAHCGDSLRPGSHRGPLAGIPIFTLEDLVILKTLAGRLQDRADLENIHARQADLHIDWAYVDLWKMTLGLGGQ